MPSHPLNTISQGLVVIAVLLAVIAAALWLRPDFASPATEPSAHAAFGAAVTSEGDGIPDSGRQRMMIVQELKTLNAEVKALGERLSAVDKSMRSGDYRVQTVEPRARREGDR